MQYEIIHIKTATGKDPSMGALSVFEGTHDLPFEIKRIYYIYGVKAGVKRGMHAHKALHQLLFCPYGAVEIELDDGSAKDRILLDDPSKGLVLYPGLWRNMYWKTDNAVLLVAASDYYDENDYIRDYDTFLDYYGKRV